MIQCISLLVGSLVLWQCLYQILHFELITEGF